MANSMAFSHEALGSGINDVQDPLLILISLKFSLAKSFSLDPYFPAQFTSDCGVI